MTCRLWVCRIFGGRAVRQRSRAARQVKAAYLKLTFVLKGLPSRSITSSSRKGPAQALLVFQLEMYWLASGSYWKPGTLCVGSHGPMPTFAEQLSVEQLIWRETGEPGARMSSPRLRPKLNLTGIVEPALYLSLLM